MSTKNEISTSFSEGTYLKYSDDVFTTETPRRLFRIIIEKDYTAIRILTALILAIITGLILLSLPKIFDSIETKYLGIIGELFLRLVNFLMLPLIGFSIVNGIAGLGSINAKKIVIRTICYYSITSVIALFIGIFLVTSIEPGLIDKSRSKIKEGINKDQVLMKIFNLIK